MHEQTESRRPAPGGLTEERDERAIITRIIANQENFVIRLYSRVRFFILRQIFLQEIGQYLPRDGRILDLGCGFRVSTLYFGLDAPGRDLTGVDLSSRRIAWARRCADRLGLTNVRYTTPNVLE